MSNICEINIGVPQGSILGPLLFIIFVNDISQHVHTGTANLFADDILIYCCGNTVQEVQSQLQKCVDEAYKWYCSNKITINVEKSCSMLIASKFNIKNNNDVLKIKIDDKFLIDMNCIKYLGINIDNILSWDEHVKYLCKMLYCKISKLQRLMNIVPSNLLNVIYNHTIQPLIDYGISIWGSTNVKNVNKLQRMQNYAARVIFNNFDYINTRGEELVKQLGWMNIKQRFFYFETLLIFKCIHGLAPDYLCNNIIMNCEINEYNTRNHDMNIFKNYVENEFGKKHLFYRGASSWNNLPDHLKDITSVENFKKQLKKYIKVNL
jgi:hypothetical protein